MGLQHVLSNAMFSHCRLPISRALPSDCNFWIAYIGRQTGIFQYPAALPSDCNQQFYAVWTSQYKHILAKNLATRFLYEHSGELRKQVVWSC
jgi:hypothetical protein